MGWVVLLSLLMRSVATGWSLVLLRRVRDWRMSFPTLVLALMTASLALRALSPTPDGSASGALSPRDVVDLVVSVAALVGVPMLARMIAVRRQVIDELEQSEARMRQVLDLVPHMIFAKDWNARFLLANKALADAYGRSVEDLMGTPQEEFQLSREELEHFLADDRAVMTSGKPKFIPEEPFTDQGGRVRILETTKIPFTASGTTDRAMLGVAVDITERKRAEDRLQLTLRELDHRVKNILALVQAVAEQSAATTDSVESFVRDFRARIKAMARMHDALRSKHWEGVDLRDLVELAVTPYRRDGDRIRSDGPEVIIPAEQVQALGMALHELAANAAKYGAGSDRGGRVEVRWTTESRDDGTLLRILWQEQGGPVVARPARRGLGLSLIEDGVRYELAGDARVRFDPDGVCAEMTISLGNVSKAPERTPAVP